MGSCGFEWLPLIWSVCYCCILYREISSLQQQLSSAESKVAMLEVELSALSLKSTTTEREYFSNEDKENVSSIGMETLVEPLKSANRMEQLNLLQRYRAAQEALKQMKLTCDALKSELTASNSKLKLALEQLEMEKGVYAKSLAHRDEIEEDLHNRINEIMDDRARQLDVNDALSAELKQMKEYIERIKRDHLRQLETLDKVSRHGFGDFKRC